LKACGLPSVRFPPRRGQISPALRHIQKKCSLPPQPNLTTKLTVANIRPHAEPVFLGIYYGFDLILARDERRELMNTVGLFIIFFGISFVSCRHHPVTISVVPTRLQVDKTGT
jgi:hypothetical protein